MFFTLKILQMTNIELYQGILEPEENGWLTYVWYEGGNKMVSDAVLIFLMPIQVRRMAECHTVTSIFETYISANGLHASLLLRRGRWWKRKKELEFQQMFR